MDQAMIHVGFPQDVSCKNSLYGCSASTQSASFHMKCFWSPSRVPRLSFSLTLLFLLLFTLSASALPSINKDGARLKLSRHLVEDKSNIVFFHAPWSKTSSRYKVELEQWQKQHDDAVVLLVNVKNLNSPVAKQYKLKSVPSFMIYDGEGTLRESGQSAQNEVVKMLSK